MEVFDRRTFGAGLLALAAATGLSACGRGSSGSGSGPTGGTVQWWEGGVPQTSLDEALVAEHKSEWGDVKVTFYGPDKMGQSLQLAHQSDQMPDLTTTGGLGIPIAQLIADGWFQPLDLPAEAKKRLDSMGLLNGIHIFDGKAYSFPVMRQSTNTVNWYHLDALEKAGLDPMDPPRTYDEFRDACKKVTKNGMAGLLLPLKTAGRNASQAEKLAQSAGFGGKDGQLFRTGEFAYHSDEYVNYLEFLKALEQDGSMFGANLSTEVKQGQARWAASESAFFWDGPWIPGNIKLDYPQLKGKVGGGPMLTPDRSHQSTGYTPPPPPYYFIPAGAEHADVANKIMGVLTTEDHQIRWCNIMGHIPFDEAAIEKADVYPIWKDVATRLINDVLFQAPEPVAGNIEVIDVDTEIKPVKPGLGEIIQGYFSGDITDLRGSLKKLSDASAKALETAIDAASTKGAKVSMDDYVFPNWKPRTDYTAEMY